jgi:hypothetical protein
MGWEERAKIPSFSVSDGFEPNLRIFGLAVVDWTWIKGRLVSAIWLRLVAVLFIFY